MASGKTTFGRALARAIGRRFIDLDFYIEQRFHRSVRDIFAERGEEGFRLLEKEMLHEVGEFEEVVISCGGGTPCHFDNMDYMNARGLTVMLDTTIECLVRRLLRAQGKRPLVAGKDSGELTEFVRSHLADRLPYYTKAAIVFEGDNLENASQISNSVEKFLGQMGRR